MSVEVVTPIYPDLKGKRVLVTGGSQGIGKATAIAFSKNEATVTIVARTVSKLEAVVAELPTKGYYASADITKIDEIKRAVGEAIEYMGGIDILINNGGVSNMDMMGKRPSDVVILKHCLDMHVVAAMALMDACSEELIKNKGCVVNVSSTMSEVVNDAIIPYGIAKSAQDALTRNMAMYWAQHGVRVNAINPGAVDTAVLDTQAEIMGISKQQLLDSYSKLHATGKYSEAFEQANAILFLTSDSSSSHITGNMLFTDGGVRLTSWFNAGLQPGKKSDQNSTAH